MIQLNILKEIYFAAKHLNFEKPILKVTFAMLG
jgi:hypothetical protein